MALVTREALASTPNHKTNLFVMLLFCWNVRGINNPDKQQRFRSWTRQHRPIFGCLLETHVLEQNADSVLASILPGWRLVTNYEHSHIGRIWIVSSPVVTTMVYGKSRQHITCGVNWAERNIAFTTSFVYGANLRHERMVLWDQLRELAADSPLRYSPWIVLGDFNQTLLPSEHSNCEDHQVLAGGRRELFNCLQDCGLSDIPSQGPIFTWWNHQQNNPIAEKLDRMLGNLHWFENFPNAVTTFEEPLFSDHAVCCIRFPEIGDILRF